MLKLFLSAACIILNIKLIFFILISLGGPHDHHASYNSKWFSKQSTSVKVVVIIIPVLVLVFVGLGVAFYCYRNSGRGAGFPVHLTAGGSKVAMQRLTNEI